MAMVPQGFLGQLAFVRRPVLPMHLALLASRLCVKARVAKAPADIHVCCTHVLFIAHLNPVAKVPWTFVCCTQVEVLAGRMSRMELMLHQAEQVANAMQVSGMLLCW